MPQFIKGNPNTDEFFRVNEEFLFIDEFRKLVDRVGKEEAGRIMWAIHLAENTEGVLYQLEPTARRENIKRNYLKDENFNWEDYYDEITAYRKYSMGPKQRLYAEYMHKMEERDRYLKTLSYSEGLPIKEAKEIDGFVTNAKGMWDTLAKIEKEYLTETESMGRVKGDKQLSALEAGQI